MSQAQIARFEKPFILDHTHIESKVFMYLDVLSIAKYAKTSKSKKEAAKEAFIKLANYLNISILGLQKKVLVIKNFSGANFKERVLTEMKTRYSASRLQEITPQERSKAHCLSAIKLMFNQNYFMNDKRFIYRFKGLLLPLNGSSSIRNLACQQYTNLYTCNALTSDLKSYTEKPIKSEIIKELQTLSFQQQLEINRGMKFFKQRITELESIEQFTTEQQISLINSIKDNHKINKTLSPEKSLTITSLLLLPAQKWNMIINNIKTFYKNFDLLIEPIFESGDIYQKLFVDTEKPILTFKPNKKGKKHKPNKPTRKAITDFKDYLKQDFLRSNLLKILLYSTDNKQWNAFISGLFYANCKLYKKDTRHLSSQQIISKPELLIFLGELILDSRHNYIIPDVSIKKDNPMVFDKFIDKIFNIPNEMTSIINKLKVIYQELPGPAKHFAKDILEIRNFYAQLLTCEIFLKIYNKLESYKESYKELHEDLNRFIKAVSEILFILTDNNWLKFLFENKGTLEKLIEQLQHPNSITLEQKYLIYWGILITKGFKLHHNVSLDFEATSAVNAIRRNQVALFEISQSFSLLHKDRQALTSLLISIIGLNEINKLRSINFEKLNSKKYAYSFIRTDSKNIWELILNAINHAEIPEIKQLTDKLKKSQTPANDVINTLLDNLEKSFSKEKSHQVIMPYSSTQSNSQSNSQSQKTTESSTGDTNTNREF